jgi:Tol biopolymer transport system component
MGEVWRARDARLARDVAIKVLPDAVARDPERLARFEREAQLLASLNHPNIAAIHGVELSGDVRALVLELVEGPTLAERLSHGPLPLDEALPLAIEIAQALEYAHERGVIHRDLKPANVKLSSEGRPKLLDFGLAKALEAGPADRQVNPTLSPTITSVGTAAGLILGTAAYMSPEQAKGRPADRRADVWAFGGLLYEMLAGAPAFHGETVSETLAEVLKSEPELDRLPASTPGTVRTLVRRCLVKDPVRRVQSIGDARVILQEVLESKEPLSSAPAASTGRLPWVLVALLGAIAIALASVHLFERPAPVPVIRATVNLPRNVSLEPTGSFAGPVALSPDGTRLVFGGRTGEGRTMLWVRALADAEPRVLPGTEGANRPFWSPDSRQVGFFTRTALKKVAADGGPVLTLAPVTDARGGTWNAAGTIVFSPGFESSLSRVSDAGGAVEPVTRLDAKRDENTHRYPSFLPDGRHFLYLARSSGAGAGRDPAIVVGSLDGGPPRALLETASNAIYAAGNLLYVKERTLMARPFDLSRLELTGEERPVISNLLVDERFSLGVFSASSDGELAYQTGLVNDLSQWVWLDRAGHRLGVLDEAGQHYGAGGVDLSPDERRCAVTRNDPATGKGVVWIVDLAHGTRQRFTRATGGDSGSPVWTPDGTALAWSTDIDEGQAILIQAASGAGPERTLFTSSTAAILSPMSFSRDGAHLLVEGGPAGSFDVWDIDVASGAPRDLLTSRAFEGFAQVSPDGRWIAYASDESGRFEVYVATYAGAGGTWQISRDGGTEPRWRGDGNELFYFDVDNTLIAARLVVAGNGVTVGATERLFQVRDASTWRYAATRDGQRFLVNVPIDEGSTSPITILTDGTASH